MARRIPSGQRGSGHPDRPTITEVIDEHHHFPNHFFCYTDQPHTHGLAGLALAAVGSAAAYGLTATTLDLTPRTEPEQAGLTATAIDATPAPTPDVEAFGITARGAD